MGVLWLTWMTACTGELPSPPNAPCVATADVRGAREVELVLEPGHFEPDGWIADPAGGDRLLAPVATNLTERATEQAPVATEQAPVATTRARLPPGPGVARVARTCGIVEIPYLVGIVPVVTLPYPSCPVRSDALPVPGHGIRLDRREMPWATTEALRALELFAHLPSPAPGEDDGPARWVTLDDAKAICAWFGARLPRRDEWEAARAAAAGTPISDATRSVLGGGAVGSTARSVAGVAPLVSASGHEDLDGNVEEWLADGTVAGGSWMARADELGVIRVVPESARTDTIGFRCAWE